MCENGQPTTSSRITGFTTRCQWLLQTHTQAHTRFWLWLVSHMADIKSIIIVRTDPDAIWLQKEEGRSSLTLGVLQKRVVETLRQPWVSLTRYQHFVYCVHVELKAITALCLLSTAHDRSIDENMASFFFIPKKKWWVHCCQYSQP